MFICNLIYVLIFRNLGKRSFVTLSLWLVDQITWQKCDYRKYDDDSESTFTFTHLVNNTCSNSVEKFTCKEVGGICETRVDGFYVEIGFSLIYGIIWYMIFKSVIYRLQRYPRDDWFVISKRNYSKNVEMI